ncbi:MULTISPECIES: TonB-dependent receptor domain-containing protein [unclassified Tenacibaculum]|uniref:TonB-dependent receptor domain-containing protein n=1 Tax=unclassified Tenacibaculum TaxID=2635139 RepID=UPI001F1AEC90|nr:MULTISPECIES: outer membrane beta-barrel family protein [unclassified Tenacibaculum]MCF2876370.1 TonB-dependent receptor [Tenacibaculum sp. Cn5-1]MCF2936487.1 TonB-dependent receptor [Tenacibaculum sp. Cn5-34]MCG7512788.1 TonB-dependent receptor [Tenacibaculum sp. Cn5-46]
MKYFTYLFLLFSISLFAQAPKKKRPKVSLSGTVIETQSKQALEYATVVLTHVKSKRVTGGITDPKGNFDIQVPKGEYAIKIEFIGFKTKTLPNQKLSQNTNLGTITLSEDTETLEEVEVIAEKSTVEIRLDKKIYNVGKDMTVKGGNASDVLDNVPSVNVDAEGAVSLRGNENVRILIDGKPSALVGLTGTDALRNLPAEAIEKVEVITAPSARYDAEGTAGILNIILRKGKITGFNGSVNLTVGNPDQFRLSPNLNYRTKKINLFSNIGYSYRKGPGNSYSKFSYLGDDNIIDSIQTEDRTFDRKNKNFNASLGLEYYLTKNSSITGSFFYRDSKGDDVATNNIEQIMFKNPGKILRIEDEDEKGTDKQYSINYTNNFDGKGQKLTIDLQYGESDETELSPITSNGILIEDNSQITTSKDKLLQIDYVLPMGENSQFEFGHKTTLQDLNSDFKVNILDPTNNFDPSNAINFKQNIYAFYTQFGSKINKFSYLLGLRTEITDIDLDVITTNQTSDKNFTEWFPTVNLGYELNDNENITLGYSRRLRRPRHWFLNPFESRSSPTNIFRGNPDLTPTFTSSYDLGYNTKISKFNLGASIYYQNSTDLIRPVSIVEVRNGTNVFVRQPVNLNDEQRYGFEFTSNYSPAKWARFSASFNYFKFNTDAFTYVYTASNGQQVTTILDEVNESSWFTRFNSRITLPAKIQWQTRIMYRGPRATAQTDRDGVFVTNLSFSKDIFKDKASLVLNVSDLFNSRKRQSTTYFGSRENPSTISEGDFQWRERQISLSFTYRFNQKKKRERPQRNFDGGGEEFGG